MIQDRYPPFVGFQPLHEGHQLVTAQGVGINLKQLVEVSVVGVEHIVRAAAVITVTGGDGLKELLEHVIDFIS